MKDLKKIVTAAITSLLTVSAFANSTHASPAPADNAEKCYGIAKAGMNDCGSAKQSCAGSVTKDRQADAYILLPKGSCAKIAGGSLEEPK